MRQAGEAPIAKKRKPPKKGTKRFRFTVAQVVAAVKANHGFLYLAAKSLACHHSTLIRYRDKHKEIDEAFRSARGEMVDAAEGALYKAILAGEGWAVCFFLKTQAKDRGYIEKQEIQVNGGVQLQLVEEIVEANANPVQNNPPAPPAA